MTRQCAICGKSLPNRYAVAGRCVAQGCQEAFCALCWNRSNRRCRQHGYAAQPPPEPRHQRERWPRPQAEEPESPAHPESDLEDEQKQKGTAAMDNSQPPSEVPADKATRQERARAAMQQALQLVKKLGAAATGLLAKLRKDKSPEAMLRTIDETLDANQKRSAGIAQRLEALYTEVATKKKAYESAPPARKRVLEAELRTKLSAYQATEREYRVLLENERVLSEVKGRMMEVLAYGMAGVSEAQIDELIDEVEEKVAEAEGRVAAARDLEKAGKRRERETDRESFEAALAEFEEPPTREAATPAAAGPEPPAPAEPEPGEKPRAPEREKDV